MTSTHDEAFLLLRRRRPAKAPGAKTTTTILYEADAEEFAVAFPRCRDRPDQPDCKDLWLHYDASTGSIDLELQGGDVDLRDSASLVNDPSRDLADRVVALTTAVRRWGHLSPQRRTASAHADRTIASRRL